MFFYPRYELKYVIKESVAQAIASKLLGHCHLDDNGKDGTYRNESLYYDSPGFDFFYHKIDGVKLRRKIRIRRYGDSGPWERVFVEIKRRNGKFIEKARLSLQTNLLPLLFNPAGKERIIKTLSPREIQVYNEIISISQIYNVQPVVFISYKRKAFWADGNEKLRITFDSDLSCDAVNLDSLAVLNNRQSMMSQDLIVMEIKANGKVPFWALRLVQEYGCHMTRLSKYCLGVQCLYNLGGNYFDSFKKSYSVSCEQNIKSAL